MGKRNELPEILETDLDERDEAVLLLEQAMSLKNAIGEEPDEDKGKEGFGLLAEYYKVKAKLMEIQVIGGLDGLRHNKIVFIASLQNGRVYTDQDAVVNYLLDNGVPAETIGAAFEAGRKTGKSYWKREVRELK